MSVHTYHQKTGEMAFADGSTATGYAGIGEGLNNPDKQHVRNVGPLPRGSYKVTSKDDHITVDTLILTPDDGNNMFGRDLFRVHGDNKKMNHTASHGCIVLGPEERKKIKVNDDINVVQ